MPAERTMMRQVREVLRLKFVGGVPILIGVNVELLRKLSKGSIALQGRKRYLRLEGRRVVSARSSVHGLS